MFPLLLACLVACQTSSTHQPVTIKALEQGLKELGHSLSPEMTYFIIPGTGCPGCIDEAEQFFIDYAAHTPHITYVLTNVGSTKALKVRMGHAAFEQSNIIIDKEGAMAKQGLTALYPTLVSVSGGVISNIESVNPQNPGVLAQLAEGLPEQKPLRTD